MEAKHDKIKLWNVIVFQVFGGIVSSHIEFDEDKANERVLAWANANYPQNERGEDFTTADEALEWFSENSENVDESITIEIIEDLTLPDGNFENGVRVAFDIVTGIAANTDNASFAERLGDVADCIISMAPTWKGKWKDIVRLSVENGALRSELEKLKNGAVNADNS